MSSISSVSSHTPIRSSSSSSSSGAKKEEKIKVIADDTFSKINEAHSASSEEEIRVKKKNKKVSLSSVSSEDIIDVSSKEDGSKTTIRNNKIKEIIDSNFSNSEPAAIDHFNKDMRKKYGKNWKSSPSVKFREINFRSANISFCYRKNKDLIIEDVDSDVMLRQEKIKEIIDKHLSECKITDEGRDYHNSYFNRLMKKEYGENWLTSPSVSLAEIMVDCRYYLYYTRSDLEKILDTSSSSSEDIIDDTTRRKKYIKDSLDLYFSRVEIDQQGIDDFYTLMEKDYGKEWQISPSPYMTLDEIMVECMHRIRDLPRRLKLSSKKISEEISEEEIRVKKKNKKVSAHSESAHEEDKTDKIDSEKREARSYRIANALQEITSSYTYIQSMNSYSKVGQYKHFTNEDIKKIHKEKIKKFHKANDNTIKKKSTHSGHNNNNNNSNRSNRGTSSDYGNTVSKSHKHSGMNNKVHSSSDSYPFARSVDRNTDTYLYGLENRHFKKVDDTFTGVALIGLAAGCSIL